MYKVFTLLVFILTTISGLLTVMVVENAYPELISTLDLVTYLWLIFYFLEYMREWHRDKEVS